ncbi:MAG: type I pullulanase [Prevotella sp.]|nr:type I pullulanase [Prevotella sp.]
MKTLKTLSMMLMALGLSLSAAAQKECCKAKACQPTHQFKYTKQATDFCFYANPDAKSVVLRLYDEGLGGKPVKTVKLQQDRQQPGYWKATVKGDLKGKFYTIDQSGNKKEWVETPGVFATAVGVNGKRGYIYEPSETNPEGWCKDKRPELKSPCDLVIYEMHHRDYSIARNTTLSPTLQKDAGKTEYPGKFLALTEPWAIDHLKNLGVNAIHILPSYDYGSVDETRLSTPQFNWGYDPVNYNVPEGSYSTDPYNPLARIREFKQMVQALHKAGIRVILDVVYNHTYDIEHSNFQRTYPDYYYRKNADGSYSNGSGCGNETASEKPMMRKFMIESVRHWINEYHIDGLRFDLMGVHDIETMNAIRHAVDEIDPSIFIYGEGWSAGSCAYPQEKLGLKAHIRQMPRIAAFSDDLRDALRGPFSDDTKGAFLAGLPGSEESIKAGIAGMISHPQVDFTKVNYSKESWVNEPSQMISYVSCHDDMCLVDRLKASIPSLKTVDGKLSDSQLAELVRLDKLAQTAVMLSQGVPFMLNGEELLRDKKGVHNSFESPDSINQINWGNLARYPQVFDYYKSLLQLRKNHPAFRLGRADLVRRHLEFLPSQDALVAFRLKDYAGGDSWNNIIVVLNGSKEQREVTIPEGTYTIVACDGVINEQGLGEITGQKVSVDPQSALIIKN